VRDVGDKLIKDLALTLCDEVVKEWLLLLGQQLSDYVQKVSAAHR